MFDAKMDLGFLGPLAGRAVEALESIAESLGTLSKTAELQHQVLTEHHVIAQHSEPYEPLRSVPTEDGRRG